ncbi:uncharacterized protein LOC115622545 [Scaptodrosophila lebanonensis]|uniref:Uncharacterized protein LOC115622545 n=1 Tax=Drosophila lebanonensis TaxID=7225 RepID=A0A6J2T620_DROLE|nr:uncharacterized protein LOC115622545 [Scaptodrosophila lebanonensis]
MEAHRHIKRSDRPSVGYLLFQYQSELTRRHAEPTRLSRTKMHIIDGLVSRTIRHLKHCSVEELQACKRELVYKEQLRNQLHGMKRKRSSSRNSKTPTTPPKTKLLNASKQKLYIMGPEIFV